MKTHTSKLSRRQFLKLAGATGVLALPSLAGYDLLRDSMGELPPSVSPYGSVKEAEGRPLLSVTDSPLLLLLNERSDNHFGAYLAEILRAEGLNCFQVARLSGLNSIPLERFDVVLLAEGPLDCAQTDLLESYVSRGGRLVAMRPDACLAFLFGLEHVAGRTADGYLQMEAGPPIGGRIATKTLQFHGVADHYRLAGAQAVAWLASSADARTDFPAVTFHRHGQGQTVLWAFDLARSVAYTRQGNPAWANQERDGFNLVRPCDMFKDWIDLDRLATPQADEQQRLLSNLLSALSQGRRPLPRLWYFPGAAETMLIATSDSHENPASAIEDVLERVERRGGHGSIYYSPPLHKSWWRAARRVRFWATDLPLVGDMLANRFPSPTSSQVARWRARGHEFAVHPYVDVHPHIRKGLEAGWNRYWEEFTGLGYGPVPPTVRTHCILWTGWVETARFQASHGLRMNLDYYHVGPEFRKQNGEWVYGHFTGSGLPMKFVDEQGRVLNIYQQLTQLADEHLLSLHWGGQVNLSGEAALEVSRMLLRRSLAGDYSAITANFHVDPFAVGGKWAPEAARFLEGTLDYATAQGIPIWSAKEWLRFTEIRHDASLEEVQWHPANGRLRFRLMAQAAPDLELALMVPRRHGEAELAQIEVDGRRVEHRERRVGGVNYGWASVEAGPHQVVAVYS